MKMKRITSIPKSNLDCLVLIMTVGLSSTKIWMDNEQGRGNRLVVHIPYFNQRLQRSTNIWYYIHAAPSKVICIFMYFPPPKTTRYLEKGNGRSDLLVMKSWNYKQSIYSQEEGVSLKKMLRNQRRYCHFWKITCVFCCKNQGSL